MTQEYIQTYLEVDGDGSNNKPFQFPSIHRTDVKVSVDGAPKTSPTHYNIIDYTPSGGGKVQFTSGNIPTSGQKILIYRDTPIGLAKSTYSAGSSVRDSDLNNNQKQFLHVAQEFEEDINDISVRQRFFVSVTPPTDPINGAFWYDPVSGRAFVYYTDVDSPQWVESNPAFGGVNTGTTDITNLTDANIAGNANISQSKLNLAITDSEVDANAAIAQSKLNLSIANADVASNAAIAQSKLDLSIGTNELANSAVTDEKVAGNAAIDAAKISFKAPYPNSVARDLESKLGNETFNVKDYGAKGDNSQDDTSAIQAAIDAVGNNGGKVTFPPGLYRIDSSLSIGTADHAIILEGLSGSTVGTDTYGARFTRTQGSTASYITISEARSIEIRNLGFIGQGTGVKPTNGAIDVNAVPGTQEYIFENLYFHNISKCMDLNGLSSSIIRNCKFRQIPEDSGDVIALSGGSTSNYSNWTKNNDYTQGDKIKNGNNYYVCRVDGTSENADNAGPTGTGLNIVDGTARWNYFPITDRSDQIRIENCIVDGFNGSGVDRNQTVSGLSIDREVNTVFVTNSSFIRLKYCIFINSTWFGDFLYFQNVEAERGFLDGFNINGIGNFITLDNCFSSSSNEHGINIGDLQDCSINITNPNIRDNKKHGILVNSPLIQNLSIVNPAMGGNSSTNTGNPDRYDNIYIANNVNNVFISGGKCGGTTVDLSGTGNTNYGVNVNGSNHTHIRIIGLDVSDNYSTQSSGGIFWPDATGANQTRNAASDNFIQFCPGYSTGQTSFP